MNKINFKNIKNQVHSNFKLLKDECIYKKGIFSLTLQLDSDFKSDDILSRLDFDSDDIILLSNPNFTSLGIMKEKEFSISDINQFNTMQNEISEFISNTFFISKNLKNQKNFIFGGYAFDPSDSYISIWEDLPVGHFILPRYIFCNSRLIINFFSKSETTKSEIEKVIFDYVNYLEVFLNNKESDYNSELLELSDITNKEIYLNHIRDVINNLNNTNSILTKVVLSRIKKGSFSKKVPILKIIKKLLFNNKHNMNFLYPIDDYYLIGSTPELILSVTDNKILSESLAGSNYKASSNEFISDAKQITEQKIVTDYILDIFKHYSKKIDFNKVPVIKKSSNIEHLCTTISSVINEKVNIFDLMRDLHPTPAISGFPKSDAMEKIKDIKENRGWYGGPIGWIDNNLNGKFFLNIRSGLISNDNIYLFSGSGITKESNIHDEWEETEQKFNSMINAL